MNTLLLAVYIAGIIGAFTFGYGYRDVRDELREVKKRLDRMAEMGSRDRTRAPEPISAIVDADDPAMIVKMEYEERMNKLNPELHGGEDGQPRR